MYFSETKNEFIDIDSMSVSYRTNAALKCIREALLGIINTKLHYSYLSNNSINELTWEEVEQSILPLANFIDTEYPEFIDGNLKEFLKYLNKVTTS